MHISRLPWTPKHPSYGGLVRPSRMGQVWAFQGGLRSALPGLKAHPTQLGTFTKGLSFGATFPIQQGAVTRELAPLSSSLTPLLPRVATGTQW